MRKTFELRGSGLPPRDPHAACDSCGTIGTVGRAVRFFEDAPTETHVYCARCWPEESARLTARWDEETRLSMEGWLRNSPPAPGPRSTGSAMESATWYGSLNYVRELLRVLRQHEPPTPDQLAEIANDILAMAPEMEGDMPIEVEMFIREYGTVPDA